MARVYERRISNIPDVDVLDWQLIERTGQLFDQYRGEDGYLRFYAADSRGEFQEGTFSAFRAEVEAQDEVPSRVMVTAHRDGDTTLHFQVWFGRDKHTRGAVFTSTNEADVVHVAERCTDLFRQANERHIARQQRKTAAKKTAVVDDGAVATVQGSSFRSFFYDPWVIGIGTALVVVGVVAFLAVLF